VCRRLTRPGRQGAGKSEPDTVGERRRPPVEPESSDRSGPEAGSGRAVLGGRCASSHARSTAHPDSAPLSYRASASISSSSRHGSGRVDRPPACALGFPEPMGTEPESPPPAADRAGRLGGCQGRAPEGVSSGGPFLATRLRSLMPGLSSSPPLCPSGAGRGPTQRAAGTLSPSRASALCANTMASRSGPSCASSITRSAARGSQHG
jgi:hypothetical protein